MIAQNETISGVPRIVTILENIEQSGYFSQIMNNNHQSQAYGSDNYTYPPHEVFSEEHIYNEEYNESNSGYESSSTVETHDVFPDSNYTPSRPTGGFPTVASTIGTRFNNMLGLGQRQQ